MQKTKFWSLIDEALVKTANETKVYVYGPSSIGRACCNTCSVAEMLADLDETTEKEVSFVYYHDQNLEEKGTETYLGWNGWDAVEEFITRATALGLFVSRPSGEHEKILVTA